MDWNSRPGDYIHATPWGEGTALLLRSLSAGLSPKRYGGLARWLRCPEDCSLGLRRRVVAGSFDQGNVLKTGITDELRLVWSLPALPEKTADSSE
jgi:hypothetical protein